MHTSFKVHSIRRYPVKGFQAECLDHTEMHEDALLPGDRMWGFTAGHTATDEIADGTWMKKAHFLQLMRFSELAKLSVKFVSKTNEASLLHEGKVVISGDLTDPNMAANFCEELQNIMQRAGFELPNKIGLRHLSTGGFSDTKAPWISLGGTASLTDFAAATQTEGHPERFRLNIWLETEKPFEELNWIGKRAKIGTAMIRFMEPVGRCAAINVHPQSAVRADDLTKIMRDHYNHDNLGVFALIEKAGNLSVSDTFTLLD